MRDKNRIYYLFLGILWISQLSSGIIIRNIEQPRPQYTSGIKTTFRKDTNPYMLQNYSRVVVHNRPDVSGAQYVVTHTDVQHVYPVYNIQHSNQRTQHQNILQTQSHTQIDAGQFNRPNKTIIKRKIESKTLEIYTKCPPGVTGQFIYSASCNQYLNCWKGRGNVQNCAPGTLFNPKSLECDFPDKVECVTGPTANTVENVRVQKSILQASCPAGFSGIIPDYFDCSKYINCDNGQENKMACAPGTLFDMNKNMCDYPQSTTCFNGDNSLEVKSTATQEQYQWNHDSNAGKYGTYHDGNYVGQETIPSYTYCNPKTQNCGQSTNYELRGSQVGSKSTTYSQTSGQHNHQYNTNNLGYGQYTGETRHDSSRGETGYQCKGPNCARPIPNYESFSTSTEYVGCNIQTMECSRPHHESTQNQYEYRIPTDYRHEGQLLKVYKVDQKYGETYPSSWQGNEYLGNGHGELNRNNCNPNTQNCGQHTSQSTIVTQFSNGPQQRPNYGKVCNLNDPNCRQNQYNNHQSNIQKSTTSSQPVCPSGFVGLHRHPTECKKYLNCANGQTFVMDCGPGTVFNPKTSVCDFPYNVDCTYSETYHASTSESSGRHTGQGQVEDNTGSYSEWHNHNENNWQDLHHDSGHDNNYATHKPYPSESYNQNNNWDNDNQHIVTGETRGKPGYVIKPVDRSPDYDDVYNSNHHHQQKPQATTARSAWPPPYQTSDSNDIGETDYIFTYDNGDPVVLEPENVIEVKQRVTKQCSDEDFHCSASSCISLALLCDNNRDCPDGRDELNCREYIERFSVAKNSRLVVVENQRYVNVSHSTCAVLCIQNKKFTCRSFTYRRTDRSCFLSDKNIGLSGALHSYQSSDYYELKAGAIDCSDKRKYFECNNKKCLSKDYVCDGYNDCDEREDEKHCGAEKFGYKIKLAGSSQKNEGRVEVTAFGSSGYICDDDFSIVDANVVCKELGFSLGAAEVKGQSYFAKDLKERNTLYMIDDLNCVGNESTIIDCSFPGWGMHNCRDQEIAGVVCKTPQEICGDDKWKCDSGNECVPFEFVCDGIEDCYDDSDEGVQHCEAPTELRLVGGSHSGEGRVEIKHNNIWGTICDDDFNEDAAKVVCKFLGFKGKSFVKKDGYFGAGSGPIWLDQVSCYGNETELNTCTHWDWGEHNCEHSEDVGVICSQDVEDNQLERHSNLPTRIEEGLPQNCGLRKDNQFAIKDLIQARVIGGGIAKKGDYPWQAALKVRVKDKSAHWCGAIIISSRWVLTAAHCLQGYTKGAYVIVAGDYNTDDDEGTEQQKYIDEFFVHEQFRKGHKLNNDVALIKVKGTGFILNDHVQPICLADSSTDYNKQMNCTISGFGSVKSGVSAYSHNLLSAWITTYSDDICKMPHVYGDVLTDGMFCAGSMDGGMDACDGDSGGPLACLDQGVFTLYGITSWGMHCGYANKPGVYVKVGSYKKWIENTIAKHSR